MFKRIIIYMLSIYIVNSKRYIITLNEEPNIWIKKSNITENKMKILHKNKHKNKHIVFVDTETHPDNFHNDNIISIEEDKIMKSHSTCSHTWGLDRMNEQDIPLDGIYLGDNIDELRGDDIDVYVLDTGININHNVFSEPPIWLVNFGNDEVDDDCDGHGTHVGGTIAGTLTGVAPNVNLFSVKISSWCSDGAYPGSAYCSDMIQAINYVHNIMENTGRKSVINLSYGICSAVTTVINDFVEAGGMFALASGNDGEDQCSNSEYSSLDKSASMLVGAATIDDEVAYFSNYGDCVDIYAPGSSVLSADYADDNKCVSWSGTSMATPHVSGAMAVLWARNPEADNTQIRSLLLDYALTDKLDFKSFNGNNKLLYLNDNSTSDNITSNNYEYKDFYFKVLYYTGIVFIILFVIINICNPCNRRNHGELAIEEEGEVEEKVGEISIEYGEEPFQGELSIVIR